MSRRSGHRFADRDMRKGASEAQAEETMPAPPLPPASTLRRPPRFPTAAAAILCVTGLVLFGPGVWIHAKALLAQVLLERAFSASLASGEPVKPWSWVDTWPVARIEVLRLHA